MGASMSSASLYRNVAIVETVTSVIISIFGVNTFLLFQQEDDVFQTEKEMIYYSSIVAVVQSFLTILSSVFLVGCRQRPPPPSIGVGHHQWIPDGVENGDQPIPLPPSQLGYPNSLRRKVVAPTWLSWTLCSIASLLFVFIAPIHYCIQAPSDVEYVKNLHRRPDGSYDTPDKMLIGLCYSKAPELMPIRSSLSDLYSFSFIGIMFKALFVLMVYRNWKRGQERAKKVIIYVERYGAGGAAGGNESAGTNSPPTEPKIIVSSFTDNDGGDCGVAARGGGGDADEGDSKKLKGAELDDVDDMAGIKK